MHESHCVFAVSDLPSLEGVEHHPDCACAAVLGTVACKEVFRLSTRRRSPALHTLQKIWSAQPQLLYAGQAVANCAFLTSALCTIQCTWSQRAHGLHDVTIYLGSNGTANVAAMQVTHLSHQAACPICSSASMTATISVLMYWFSSNAESY